MVKVVVDDTRGLVQSAGSGCAIEGRLNVSNLNSMTVTPAEGSSLGISLTSKRTTITPLNATTTTDTTGTFIPAGAKVVACSVSVATAGVGGNTTWNVTDWGQTGDADYFNVSAGQTLANNVASVTVHGSPDATQAPVDQFFPAGAEVRVTHANPGVQTTATILSVNLWYYDMGDLAGH